MLVISTGLSFGQWLKMRRAELGLSQSEFARQIGVVKQAVSFWESDRNLPNLTPDKMLVVCSVLKVDLETLAAASEGATVKAETVDLLQEAIIEACRVPKKNRSKNKKAR